MNQTVISMPKLRLIFILVVIAFAMAGCQSAGPDNDKPVVSVSIQPLKFFVDRLSGETLEVNVMVPSGASPATYSPTTGQLEKLSDSGIYFRIGHLGYEQFFLHRLAELNPGMKVLNLSEEVKLIRGEPLEHGDHVHEGGVDPHIWMSPAVMGNLLPAMRDAIIGEYPELEETVTDNYQKLYSQISELHNQWEALSVQLNHDIFMIFHPALTYLARDYGFTQVPVERGGKEPSPATLRRIIDMARSRDIPVIFIQQEFDVRSAQLISEESGAKLVQINPLAYNWQDEMEHLLEIFKNHLQ